MKKIILLATSLLSIFLLPIAFAKEGTPVGPYVGLGIGYGKLRYPTEGIFIGTTTVIKGGGLSGRVFLGYNLYKFFGIEAGFAQYAKLNYSANSTITVPILPTPVGLHSSLNYSSRTIDIVGKFYIPFDAIGVNLYVLTGGARVYQQVTFNNEGIPTSISLPAGTTKVYKTRPIYGIGMNTNITCRLFLGLEYTQIQDLGKSNVGYRNYVPFMNLATVNLSYYFA